MASIPKCTQHHNKKVLSWCEFCSKLVCSRCIKAEHIGHRLTDINEAANEKEEKLQEKLTVLEHSIQKATGVFRKKCKFREILNDSVKETKKDIRIRAAQVKQWIENQEERLLEAADDVANQYGREELCSTIRDIENTLQRLQRDREAILRVFKANVNGHGILKEWSRLSQIPTVFEMDEHQHQTYVFLPDTIAVEWEKNLRMFIGEPRVAETTFQAPSTAVALQMESPTEVMALHAMSNNHVCMVFSDRIIELPTGATDTGALCLGVLNQESQFVLRKRLPKDMKRPRISSTLSNKILVVCTLTGAKEVVDAGTWSFDDEENRKLQEYLCCIKVDSHKKTVAQRLSSIRTERYKIYKVTTDSTEALFSVQSESPETVVADANGKYFAVIQNCYEMLHTKTGKRPPSETNAGLRSSVAVFEKPIDSNAKPQLPSMTFIPRREKDFRPTDVCFYRDVDLLVAESSGVHMVLYERSRSSRKVLSPCSCPLLDTAITVLNTDSYGRLWMGCPNGKILNWMLTEEVSHEHYLNPEFQDDSDSDAWSYESWSEDDIEHISSCSTVALDTRMDNLSASNSDLPDSDGTSRVSRGSQRRLRESYKNVDEVAGSSEATGNREEHDSSPSRTAAMGTSMDHSSAPNPDWSGSGGLSSVSRLRPSRRRECYVIADEVASSSETEQDRPPRALMSQQLQTTDNGACAPDDTDMYPDARSTHDPCYDEGAAGGHRQTDTGSRRTPPSNVILTGFRYVDPTSGQTRSEMNLVRPRVPRAAISRPSPTLVQPKPRPGVSTPFASAVGEEGELFEILRERLRKTEEATRRDQKDEDDDSSADGT